MLRASADETNARAALSSVATAMTAAATTTTIRSLRPRWQSRDRPRRSHAEPREQRGRRRAVDEEREEREPADVEEHPLARRLPRPETPPARPAAHARRRPAT